MYVLIFKNSKTIGSATCSICIKYFRDELFELNSVYSVNRKCLEYDQTGEGQEIIL